MGEEKQLEEKNKRKSKHKSKKETNEDDSDVDFDSNVEDLSGGEEDEEEGNESDEEHEEEDDGEVDDKPKKGSDNAEDEWSAIKDDDLIQTEKLLELKSKESHIVHCPYFPGEKHEYWWIYIVSKKTNELLTPPQQITNLKEEEEVQLKFTAPEKPGTYQYYVVIRSDAYVDFDTNKSFKINVSEAKEFDPGAHWDYSSDEEGKDDSGESVYETEEDDDDDDDESDDE